MSLVVQKFGGTSVGDVEKIKNVARRVAASKKRIDHVVVVVSALGDTTDRLLDLAGRVSASPPEREMDMLLSTGEQVSMALLAMALEELGLDAVSMTGQQVEILTDTGHTKAKIRHVGADRVIQELRKGRVVVVAGFQGVTSEGEITTLGRGGSDTTAVALAAALHADCCEIYTDVDGVFTADPRLVADARKLARISFHEMLEMAVTGARVLQSRSVEYARNYNVPLVVRSSFHEGEGTWIVSEDEIMEKAIVSAVTHDFDEAKVTVMGVPDRPGVAAGLFGSLAEANVNVDMIIQNVSEKARTDISFTVSKSDLDKVRTVAGRLADELGAAGTDFDSEIAKVSLIGAGMRTHPGIAAGMFRTLADNDINIEMISTSPIKISCVVRRADGENAVRALHEHFHLEVETE
ncbi:MAG: aspartate kinase [Actinobacteria bacterium]|nr:aspartate kinase [Actinomycetota bacterium]MBU1944799.1 aspartate kinase [Actinomycetota bacterium]MBU2688891.1 aspartate kinase [Actinomycetota bacterium]